MAYDPSVGPDDIAPGTPMDPIDHPARSMPQATQHYAGDIMDGPLGGTGQDSRAVEYALGQKKDPKVLPIGNKTLGSWAKRQQGK